jgi:transcriptional regulator with XRE-family HTH domain
VQTRIDLTGLPLGKRLRLLRQAKGLTLFDVAKQLGVYDSRISELERGQREDPGLAAQYEELLASVE